MLLITGWLIWGGVWVIFRDEFFYAEDVCSWGVWLWNSKNAKSSTSSKTVKSSSSSKTVILSSSEGSSNGKSSSSVPGTKSSGSAKSSSSEEIKQSSSSTEDSISSVVEESSSSSSETISSIGFGDPSIDEADKLFYFTKVEMQAIGKDNTPMSKTFSSESELESIISSANNDDDFGFDVQLSGYRNIKGQTGNFDFGKTVIYWTIEQYTDRYARNFIFSSYMVVAFDWDFKFDARSVRCLKD